MIRDLTGQRFTKLVAKEVAGCDASGKTVWRCVCDCGNESTATMLNLTTGNTKSCGCLRHISKRKIDITGLRFGRLMALRPVGGMHWACLCDCGTECVVSTVHLRRTHTRSCGCIKTGKTPTRLQMLRRGRNAIAGWANEIKDMASRKCDCCSSESKLHAHHMFPFSTHREACSDIENGACLCKRCHIAVHQRISNGETPGDALANEILESNGFSSFEQAVAKLLSERNPNKEEGWCNGK